MGQGRGDIKKEWFGKARRFSCPPHRIVSFLREEAERPKVRIIEIHQIGGRSGPSAREIHTDFTAAHAPHILSSMLCATTRVQRGWNFTF